MITKEKKKLMFLCASLMSVFVILCGLTIPMLTRNANAGSVSILGSDQSGNAKEQQNKAADLAATDAFFLLEGDTFSIKPGQVLDGLIFIDTWEAIIGISSSDDCVSFSQKPFTITGIRPGTAEISVNVRMKNNTIAVKTIFVTILDTEKTEHFQLLPKPVGENIYSFELLCDGKPTSFSNELIQFETKGNVIIAQFGGFFFVDGTGNWTATFKIVCKNQLIVYTMNSNNGDY